VMYDVADDEDDDAESWWYTDVGPLVRKALLFLSSSMLLSERDRERVRARLTSENRRVVRDKDREQRGRLVRDRGADKRERDTERERYRDNS
jgi:hypothetical protein